MPALPFLTSTGNQSLSVFGTSFHIATLVVNPAGHNITDTATLCFFVATTN